MSFSKGQGALEYMQTYGWAILVVLTIGIAMWQLGVFGGKAQVNTAQGFAHLKILDPSIKYITDDDTDNDDILNFTIMNVEGIRLSNIESIVLGGDCPVIILGTPYDSGVIKAACDLDPSCGWDEINTACWCQEGIRLDPGETVNLKFSVCSDLDPGEQFEVRLTFHYEERVGKDWIKHEDSGVVRGTAE